MVGLIDLDATHRLPKGVVLFSDDQALADGLSRVADGCRMSGVEAHPGGLEAALSGPAGSEEVIIIDCGSDAPDLHGMEALCADRKRRVVAVGVENDVRLLHRLQAVGVADYLVHPVNDDELLEALRLPLAMAVPATAEGPAAGPRTTVVIGCRGGIGATGFAVSAAWWSAEKLQSQTALIDLDLVFGTATLALDLMPGRGMREALENPERIDPLFIGSAMINATERLFVLGAEEPPGQEISPTATGMARLLEAVRDTIPSVIVDLPRQQLPTSEPLLAAADEIVLVADLSLGGLRDAIRLKALCQSMAPNVETTLLAMLPSVGPPPVERKEFERAYEGAVDWLIPWEPKVASQVVTEGKPLVTGFKPKHAYAQAVRDVAERAVPDSARPQKAKRKWLW